MCMEFGFVCVRYCGCVSVSLRMHVYVCDCHLYMHLHVYVTHMHIHARTHTHTYTFSNAYCAYTYIPSTYIHLHIGIPTDPQVSTNTVRALHTHAQAHIHPHYPTSPPMSHVSTRPHVVSARPSRVHSVIEREHRPHSGRTERAHRDRPGAHAGRGQPRDQERCRPTRTGGTLCR